MKGHHCSLSLSHPNYTIFSSLTSPSLDKHSLEMRSQISRSARSFIFAASKRSSRAYPAGARWTAPWSGAGNSSYPRLDLAGCQFQRHSTLSEKRHEMLTMADVLPYILSSLHQLRGPSHCWLNTTSDRDNLFEGEAILLVVVVEYPDGSFEANQNTIKMLEKAKLLQQRNPSLKVLVLQNSIPNDFSSHLVQIVKDYITFPILLSDKNIFEGANLPCYIISKGFQNPIIYSGEDVDLEVLNKEIHDLNVENGEGSDRDQDGIKRAWVKPVEVVKEPDVCSASRNLLFSLPGCISVDGSGDRLFLSDVNHHRIIVFNSNGNFVDAIGSSPGFEDGEFEMAKLMRPAASFYDSSENCLYFVDSENHAIRRADMERRVVETVFPVTDSSMKKKGLLESILDKIWTKRNIDLDPEDVNSESLLFPWHLLKSAENDVFILNRSFNTLWILDLESGCIREVVKDPSKILEICGQMILEKCIPLRELPADWLHQQSDTNFSSEGLPYSLMSSAAACHDDIVYCDTVGQAVVKFSRGSGSAATFRWSNFGILGLPYWLRFPLEKVYTVGGPSESVIDHVQCFNLLPGRVEIELTVDIPVHTDLVEPLQEGCIWRQARGAATDVSGLEKDASIEKVGVGQQFYDSLDNLIFEEEEPNSEEEIAPLADEVQEGRVRMDCAINTSPGISELIINAALYLRLKKSPNSQGEKAQRIAEMLEPKSEYRKELLVKVLTMSERELDNVVFVRPLHIRLKFECGDHPKGDHTKEVVLTDSFVKLHVTL